jgi:hypothetical protein
VGRRRRGKWKGLGWISSSPFLLACFAAAVLLIVLLSYGEWAPGHGGAPAPPPSAAVPLAEPPPDPLGCLAGILADRAQWSRGDGPPRTEWRGTIPAETGLVRWNAGLTTALQAAGLEVLSGREELTERKGRWPQQRLTLEVGAAGEHLATVVVETTRNPALPAAF